jgi:hypothetical protein
MRENNNESSSLEEIPIQTNKLTIHHPDTIGYINPEMNEPVPTINRFESIIENQLKIEIYNTARMVKIFSMIDMGFIIVQLAASIYLNNIRWVVFLFFPLCYCGYHGAKNYNKSNIIGYCVYLSIMTVLYLAIVLAYFNFFYLILFFIEIYILNFTAKLVRLMSTVTYDSIESLQNGWCPEQEFVVLYYY